jgi:hypothetical protein
MPEPDTLPLPNFRFEAEVIHEDGRRVRLGPCFVSALRARRVVPGLFRWLWRAGPLARVTIRRGITGDQYLFDWHQAALAGKPEKRDVQVFQFSRDPGDLVNTWTLKDCIPVGWEGPEFDAMHPDVAYEEVVLTYPTIEWSSP